MKETKEELLQEFRQRVRDYFELTSGVEGLRRDEKDLHSKLNHAECARMNCRNSLCGILKKLGLHFDENNPDLHSILLLYAEVLLGEKG